MKRALGIFFLANLAFAGMASAQTTDFGINSDYKVTEVLHAPNLGSFFTFDFEGNYIFTKTNGSTTQIVKTNPAGEQTVLVQRVSQPILGLSYHLGRVYVSLRGRIDVVNKGSLSDIISGLPAFGDYTNSGVVFGEDGKMYFSVGTATNSGIVGPDNTWLRSNPSVHDLLCPGFAVNQVNITGDNFLTAKKDDKAITGAFMPFNTQAYTDTPPVSEKCNGVVMQANADGSNLKVVATGLHNLKGLSFDSKGNLYAIDSAMENRGVRPVSDGKDSLFLIREGDWYGWPDYSGGKKLDSPLIMKASFTPTAPIAIFDSGVVSQFVASQFESGIGLVVVGNKINEVNLSNGKLSDFATIPNGYKINQIKFGPDKNLYVLISNDKESKLYEIETSSHPIVGASTKATRTLPVAWSISLSVMTVGLIATYVVYKNRQQQIL